MEPSRTVPRALIGTLLCATLLPVAASVALVGFASYDVIDPSSGFAVAFEQRPNFERPYGSYGEFCQGMDSIVLFCPDRPAGCPIRGDLHAPQNVLYETSCSRCFLAQPRVFYALARDGLLPKKQLRFDTFCIVCFRFAELDAGGEPWFATLMRLGRSI